MKTIIAAAALLPLSLTLCLAQDPAPAKKDASAAKPASADKAQDKGTSKSSKPAVRKSTSVPVGMGVLTVYESSGVAKSTSTADAYVKKETWFSLPSIEGGKNIDLQTYAGHPVLVIILSPDCHFCQKAVPFMQKLYTTYKDRGLGVVAIALDNDSSYVKEFAKEFGLTFPIAKDADRSVARAYKTRGVPWITMLDKQHNSKRVWIGYTEDYDQEIIGEIDGLLK